MRLLAKILVFAGLLTGFGIPVLFGVLKIAVAMTSTGFDLSWLVPIVLMIGDFALAWYFCQRASKLESSMPPASSA